MLHSTFVPQSLESPKTSPCKAVSPLRLARKTGTVCKQCHHHFYPTNKRGRVPEYCSGACKSRAYRQAKAQAELTIIEQVAK